MSHAYDYDFQDRMAAGKSAAMDRRNRGLPTGKPAAGWNRKPPLPEDTEFNRLQAELEDVRAQLREARNQLAGGSLEPIDDYGAEFDRLVGGSLPAPARSLPAQSTPARTRENTAMTTKQYLDALKKLGLKPSSRDTAAALGLSIRQCQNLAWGKSPISATLERLIVSYLEHGLPQD